MLRFLKDKRLISFVLGLVILFVLFIKIDWHAEVENILQANLSLMLMAVLLTVLYPIFNSMRWLYALRSVELNVSFFSCLYSVLMAFSINVVAPAKIGDFIKGYALRNIVSIKKSTPVVIAERLGDLLVIDLLALLASIVLDKKNIILLAIVFLIVWLLAVFLSEFLCKKNIRFGKVGKYIQLIFEGMAIWKRVPVGMLKSAFWSLIGWIVAVLQVFVFYHAFGVPINFFVVLALFPVAVFITLIPITFAGIGVRETAFVLLFAPYALLHDSVSVSLSYFICSYGLTGLMGMSYIAIVSCLKESIVKSNVSFPPQ